jgi:hypothetical protein
MLRVGVSVQPLCTVCPYGGTGWNVSAAGYGAIKRPAQGSTQAGECGSAVGDGDDAGDGDAAGDDAGAVVA